MDKNQKPRKNNLSQLYDIPALFTIAAGPSDQCVQSGDIPRRPLGS